MPHKALFKAAANSSPMQFPRQGLFNRRDVLLMSASAGLLTACGGDSSRNTDITLANKVSVDRFSDAAAHLFKRSGNASLPVANAAVDFDSAPFITKGLSPTGTHVMYYNFDGQSTTPDDIYVCFKQDGTQVVGQNNIIPTIPGDNGYNDFWLVNKVTVPDGYVPNSLQSEAEVLSSNYPIQKTTIIVNCPVVPFGSIARHSHVANVASALTLGWYKNQAVAYFNFAEAPLTLTASMVPVDDIYVMFNINPNQPNGGPSSGFKVEDVITNQTHNVVASVPGSSDYSPLWAVSFIDNAHFAMVSNLTTALASGPTAADINVNCPIVQ